MDVKKWVVIGKIIGLLIRVMDVRKDYFLGILKVFERCGLVKIVGKYRFLFVFYMDIGKGFIVVFSLFFL